VAVSGATAIQPVYHHFSLFDCPLHATLTTGF
jgi:hypothetical protein